MVRIMILQFALCLVLAIRFLHPLSRGSHKASMLPKSLEAAQIFWEPLLCLMQKSHDSLSVGPCFSGRSHVTY